MFKPIWVGTIAGGIIGQFIPSLWGADTFSLSTALFSFIFGALGLWAGFKVQQNMD